eukprot:2438581-Rhodomonas_salina.1
MTWPVASAHSSRRSGTTIPYLNTAQQYHHTRSRYRSSVSPYRVAPYTISVPLISTTIHYLSTKTA